MEFTRPLIYLYVTSPFGFRTHPVTGEQSSFHNGIDLRAVEGSSVYTILPGTVENVYYNDIGGNQITILHADGYRSGYAHLKDTLVVPGQNLGPGQLIAYSGNTGTGTAPHLHFTVKKDGEYIDPETIDYSITDLVKKNPIKTFLIGASVGLLLFLYFKK